MMKNHLLKPLTLTLLFIVGVISTYAAPTTDDSIFSSEEILDESTLETKILQDWHTDAKTGAWTAAIPLKDGASRIDFFSNHRLRVNGYLQYLSSPYTRVELPPPAN